MSVKMLLFMTLCFCFVDVKHGVQRCEELSLGRQIGDDGERLHQSEESIVTQGT